MHTYATSSSRVPAMAACAVAAVMVAVPINWAAEAVSPLPNWLVSPPSVAGAFALLYAGFNRYAWHWRPALALGLSSVPSVRGTYEGELLTDYTDQSEPLTVRIVVDQTWTEMSIRLDVLDQASSTSTSTAAALHRLGNGNCRLIYTYSNKSDPVRGDVDMSDHDGATEVTVDADGTWKARYFNYRMRRGVINAARVQGPG